MIWELETAKAIQDDMRRHAAGRRLLRLVEAAERPFGTSLSGRLHRLP